MENSKEKEKIEKQLWDNYCADKTIENRNAIVEFYSELVNYIAGRLSIGKPPNVEFNDLVSYGVLGLIDAIEKFDVSKNIKFSTYAAARIKGGILDELRNFDWIPRSVRMRAKQIQKAYMELESRMGSIPSDEEIANYLNISIESYHNMLFEINGTFQLSLDDTWNIGKDSDEITIMERVEAPSKDSPEAQITREEIKKEIINTIQTLPEKERLVLALYYYENLTLKEIGQVLEITESRVCQIHAKSISIVKARLMSSFGYSLDDINKS